MGYASECVRFLVYSTNFLFMFFGLILLVGGAVVQLLFKDVFTFVPNEVLSLPIVTIIIGAAIFCLAFFAHCGATQKNVCMLRMFMLFIGLLFALEVTIGVAGYFFHSQVQHGVEIRMKDSMVLYGSGSGHIADTVAWDEVQRGLQCCGVNAPSDWEPYLLNLGGYPASCNPSPDRFDPPGFKKGCLPMLVDAIQTQIVILAAVVIGISVVQLMALVFAGILVHAIRNERKAADMEPLMST